MGHKNNNPILLQILSYVLTIFAGALGIVILISIRNLILILLPLTSINKFSWNAIDISSSILLLLLWFIAVMIGPFYFERSLIRNNILINVGFVFGIELLALSISRIIPIVIGIIQFTMHYEITIIFEGIVGISVICISLSLKRFRQKKINNY